jgi:hypothetical protein
MAISAPTEMSRSFLSVKEEAVLVSREQLLMLEEAIMDLPVQINADELTEHHFAPGIYLRSLFLPAGAVLTGKIHRHETMNILVYGTLKVTTDQGVKTIEGPYIYNSEPGTKKAGYAVTDCLFYNIHPTSSTDLEEIEAEFIVPSFEALDHENALALKQEIEP